MLAEFTVVPLCKGESLSAYVAEVAKMIDESGLEYRVGPMGTAVEGDWPEVMELIRLCHQRMFEFSDRVSTHISIDDRKGAQGRLSGKVKSVEEKVGRTLKK